ncbi:MAG: rRNA maturation RNase YbeY [Fimbriimonas sp.]
MNEAGRRTASGEIKRAILATLARFGNLQGSVSVLITTDEGIRELNRTYRQIDEPTDVLTFPAADFPEDLDDSAKPLGDIAISRETALRQARARKIPVALEITYLAIHGALHLAGFDDETDAERDAMIAHMNEVAVSLGLPADPSWSSLHSLEAPV